LAEFVVSFTSSCVSSLLCWHPQFKANAEQFCHSLL